MQHKLIKRTLIYSVVFTIAAMAVILYAASHKVIVIADVAQDEVTREKTNNDTKGRTFLSFEDDTKSTDYICIPLEEGIKAETVTIENHYMDSELWIILDGYSGDFYNENLITGNQENIDFAYYEQEGKKTRLKFSLTGIYEYRSILEENNLYIEFMTPHEMYEKIVVIDPAAGGKRAGKSVGGLTEKDITLGVARKLKDKLDATDIKVYYTRMEDTCPSESSRVSIANNTKADMLIRIQSEADEDVEIFGTSAVYNGSFFIPDFGSIELADLLEREVAGSISGKAIGLVAAEEKDYVLSEATVPAAAINVGYITNKKEAELLKQEKYLDKIAAGIYNAIIKAYESAD